MIALGVDPGLSGGLAIVSGDHMRGSCLVQAIDVPVIGLGAKRRVDVTRVLAFLQKYKPGFALIERAQAMPEQGASSGFHYGRAVGSLEACIMGMQIPLEIVEAASWKAVHGLRGLKGRDGKPLKQNEVKEASRQRAKMLWPAESDRMLYLHGHHNRAEAALIAAFGIELNAGKFQRIGQGG